MSQWYYSKDGQQVGPVELDALRELVRAGGVDGTKELAWTPGMADWMPISRIPDLVVPGTPPQVSPMTAMPGQPDNPYAAPASAWQPPEPAAAGELQEITPGSEPLDPIACLKRAWQVMAANVGTVAALFVVWFVLTLGIGIIGGIFEEVFGVGAEVIGTELGSGLTEQAVLLILGNILIQIVMAVPSIWLTMGLIHACLNLVDGKPAAVGMLFGEGSKLLRALGATIMFYLIVSLGLLLLIVPGIYLAIRLYFSRMAIVDRDMGALESLSYSWRLTSGNGLSLFAYWVLAFLLIIAGILLCLVGLIVAVPWVSLAGFVVFRWLQYGGRVAANPLPPQAGVFPPAQG